MISPESLRNIIRISLKPLDWWSPSAEELLLMTAAHESRLGQYTKQIKGPALGLYQMEPDTLKCNYKNWINYRSKEAKLIHEISGVRGPDRGQLQFNPIYSTIHARLKYLRAPGALPPPSDVWALAEYSKDFFNTRLGDATPDDYFQAYKELVLL